MGGWLIAKTYCSELEDRKPSASRETSKRMYILRKHCHFSIPASRKCQNSRCLHPSPRRGLSVANACARCCFQGSIRACWSGFCTTQRRIELTFGERHVCSIFLRTYTNGLCGYSRITRRALLPSLTRRHGWMLATVPNR